MKIENVAPAPLFRDPIYDCPTDPTVIYNRDEEQWYLFYTQRRATDPQLGVAWVHGTKIGIASSKDGSKWLYRGTLNNLDFENGHNTFWAPEIVYEDSAYHMYVSYIQGIPNDWDYPRQIIHYTSNDLWNWECVGPIDLDSDRVIDACIYKTADKQYKMWYKDESNGSLTYAAESSDLHQWRVLGPEITDCAQEGPNVFEFGGYKWLISDFWDGLAVYRSDDFKSWSRNNTILSGNGTRDLDLGDGHHADILVHNGRVFIFYFTHPFLEDRSNSWNDELGYKSRAVIQVAELEIVDGKLV